MSGATEMPIRSLDSAQTLLVDQLHVRHGDFEAVNDASLRVGRGETMALVGESGSGKSTLAHAIARLLPTGSEISAGSVSVDGLELSALAGRELRRARGRVAAYLAQDSMAALNPVLPIGLQVGEVFAARDELSRRESRARAVEALGALGIRNPERVAAQHPHELSGGMRQRVMIAIALALRPTLLIADEPTTALDVTVQAEILELARELQREHGVTMLWITHDIGVVAEIADSVAVMYAGRIVESGPVETVFGRPAHPYTQALLAIQRAGREAPPKTPFPAIPGAPPTRRIPSGCAFHPRCPHAAAECVADRPGEHRLDEDWLAACHRLGSPA